MLESERVREREGEKEREASFENTWIHVFFFRTSLNILSIINPIVANNGHYEERENRAGM